MQIRSILRRALQLFCRKTLRSFSAKKISHTRRANRSFGYVVPCARSKIRQLFTLVFFKDV